MNGASIAWRVAFVIGGLLYFRGSSQHPRADSMAGMMRDPIWVQGHSTILVGIIILTIGLVLFRRTQSPLPALDRWVHLTTIAMVLEAIEMAVHTVAYVDADALAAGTSAPIATTHVWLATLIYPLFGIALFRLVRAGMQTGELGSRWIGWLGFIGAVAHGVVMVLVVHLGIGAAGILFPLAAVTIAAWFILAGVWKRRETRDERLETRD